MLRIATHRSVRGSIVAASAALLFLAGCMSATPTETTGPGATQGAPPVVAAEFEILDLQSTTEDPNSHGTCQTGATIQLRAFQKAADGSIDKQSYDPEGESLSFSWTDEVDFGDGVRYASIDWGLDPGDNVIHTDDLEINTQLYTIAIHYITLTVRTPDGRSATHEIRFTVTACEECGTGG